MFIVGVVEIKTETKKTKVKLIILNGSCQYFAAKMSDKETCGYLCPFVPLTVCISKCLCMCVCVCLSVFVFVYCLVISSLVCKLSIYKVMNVFAIVVIIVYQYKWWHLFVSVGLSILLQKKKKKKNKNKKKFF